jgi:HSP20 family protein
MSPFGQLNLRRGYGGGIDTNFNPILHYIDEIDRHFSYHHRLMNCFIPRFDLEEDDRSYYLYGEVAGAKACDIAIEPQDSHVLEISGSVHRQGTGAVHGTPRAEEVQSDENKHHSSAPTDTSKSESKKNHHQRENKVLISERLVGTFHRTFSFPKAVDEGAIKASLKDGLLKLQIPKMEEFRPAEKAPRVPVIADGS